MFVKVCGQDDPEVNVYTVECGSEKKIMILIKKSIV